MTAELEGLVRLRADGRCEYCRVPEANLPTLPFHIVARKHGGITDAGNLALACPRCNMCKGTDLTTINHETGRAARLFNPRRDTWSRHFDLREGHVVGLTSRGRMTVELLQMNHPQQIPARNVELPEDTSPVIPDAQ